MLQICYRAYRGGGAFNGHEHDGYVGTPKVDAEEGIVVEPRHVDVQHLAVTE